MSIFAVVGPSGAGKDTLLAEAARQAPWLCVARRSITRPADAGGEDHEALTPTEFSRRAAAGDFAVSWEAHGLSYGIPNREVLRAGGKPLLFNGSRAALSAALKAFPDLTVVLVTAPPDVLAERLAKRGRESRADIEDRLKRAGFDLPDGITPMVVVNDRDISTAVNALLALIEPFVTAAPQKEKLVQ
jgi:ribose 1,5-bisphosphokinase